MDVFEGRYLNINKKLLTCLGFWPYAFKSKILVRSILITSLFVLMMPHLISAIINYNDIDRLMLNLVCFLTAMVMFLKMIALTVSENKMVKLYENIAKNWQDICDDKEREILVEYSARGRTLTIFYGNCSLFQVTMCTAGTLISLLPSIPKILDQVNPLEKPRANLYLMEGEFFVDRDTYYVTFFLWDSALTLLVTAVTIIVDTMYVVSTEHACALYAIISYRLRNFMQAVLIKPGTSEDDSYNRFVSVIQLHQKVLSFTSTLNDAYSTSFLFILTINLPLIPLEACAIISHLHTMIGLLPYALYFNAITIHLIMIFWPGQRVLDHNLSLCNDAYCDEWYAAPLRTKKLLLIFMLRCNYPASLSAGGLFLINFETFSMIMRTSVSYIAVVASFR